MIGLIKFGFQNNNKKINLIYYYNNYLKALVPSSKCCTKSQLTPSYIYFGQMFSDDFEKSQFLKDFKVIEGFLNEKEEASLVRELNNQLKSIRYELNHWDDAITSYRETEKLKWDPDNAEIIDRVKRLAFKNQTNTLERVHVLDLMDTGVIKPHIDSIKFCGDTIAGISLLSDSVMKLIHNELKCQEVSVLLKRCSLYIMSGIARYNYTHEILGNENSKFGDQIIKKGRRISVICRNKP